MQIIRAKINEILEEAKKDYGIGDKIKVVLKPMKVKAASVSLKKGIVRLNKNIVDPEDDVLLRYLIYHELAHYKLKSKYHTRDFYELLYSKIGREQAVAAEEKIIRRFTEIRD